MRVIIGLSIATSIALAGITDSDFHFQDYMDFGQNKGRFKAGAKDLYLTRKDGTKFNFDPKIYMPNFTAMTDDSATFTYSGGSYLFTATHNKDFYKVVTIDGVVYNKVNAKTTPWGAGDQAIVRTDKFITQLVEPEGYLSFNGDTIDKNRYTEAFRSGSGVLQYRNKETGKVEEIKYIYHKDGVRTGGRFEMSGLKHTHSNLEGFFYKNTDSFSNIPWDGDSGSPLFIWDSKDQKWLLAGVVSSSATWVANYGTWNPRLMNEMKEQHNVDVYTKGMKLKWKSLGDTRTELRAQKKTTIQAHQDIFLYGGGSIVLENNIDQKSGGIYFDDNKNYIVESAQGSDFYWKGGGLSIGQGSTVHWKVKGVSGDALHKIGKGTLAIYKQNGGDLSLGDGIVELKTDNKAFEKITITSGRGTLKINNSKQVDTDRLFFTKNGGTLDMNGQDLTFHYILANDQGAKIINSNSKKATLKLDLKKPSSAVDAANGVFLFHGDIGDNIHIIKDSNRSTLQNLLAFDGNIYNPNGDLTFVDGTLAFQGKPVIHAYTKQWIADIIRQKTGDTVLTSPTSLSQKDWEKRVFVLKEISIKKDSQNTSLTLGRDSFLLANLIVDGAKVQFGGTDNTYVDRFDGENLSNNNFRQSLTKGTSQQDDSFFFEGNILGRNHSTFLISNTKHNPLKFGSFIGTSKTNLWQKEKVNYTVSLDQTSTLNAKYVNFYGNGQTIFESRSGASTIQHLSLFEGTSKVRGNLVIGKAIALETINTAIDTKSSLVFNSLRSTMRIEEGVLTLAPQTTLFFAGTIEKVFKDNMTYNTLYPLITSQFKINDQRIEKNVQMLQSLPQFLRPKTKNEHNKISIYFERDIRGKSNFSGFTLNSLQQNSSQDSDFLENYLAWITQDAGQDQEQRIALVLQSLGSEKRKILEGILKNNVNNDQKHQELGTDLLLYEASLGRTNALQKNLGENKEILHNLAYSGITLDLFSLRNASAKNYQKTLRFILENQAGFNKTSAMAFTKQALASANQTSFLISASDVDPMSQVLTEHTQDQNKNNNLWINFGGNYGKSSGELYGGGFNAGYDHIFLSNSDTFLSFGVSLNYAYNLYKQSIIQEVANSFIAGAHLYFTYHNNEFAIDVYGGGNFNEYTANSQLLGSNLSKTKNTSTLLSSQILYKYNFELGQGDEDLYQSIKPVAGIEITHLNIPTLTIGTYTANEIDQGFSTIKTGVEYAVATRNSAHTLSAIFNYNLQNIKDRYTQIGSSKFDPIQTHTQKLFLEIAYSGLFEINSAISFDYALKAGTSLMEKDYYNLGGNIGINWKF